MDKQPNFTDCDFMSCLPTKGFSPLDQLGFPLDRGVDQKRCILRFLAEVLLIRIDDFSGLLGELSLIKIDCFLGSW